MAKQVKRELISSKLDFDFLCLEKGKFDEVYVYHKTEANRKGIIVWELMLENPKKKMILLNNLLILREFTLPKLDLDSDKLDETYSLVELLDIIETKVVKGKKNRVLPVSLETNQSILNNLKTNIKKNDGRLKKLVRIYNLLTLKLSNNE